MTLVEAVVAITLLGIGLTSSITALTRFNAFASSSRNLTGAYTSVMTQIDAIESASPFDPLNVSETGAADPLIPAVLVLDSARSPAGPLTETVRVYIYKDPNKDPADPTSDIVVVNGTRKTSVVDATPTLQRCHSAHAARHSLDRLHLLGTAVFVFHVHASVL